MLSEINIVLNAALKRGFYVVIHTKINNFFVLLDYEFFTLLMNFSLSTM